MNRDVIVIAGGRLLAAVIALVSLRVSTTLLSVEEFGLMALMLGAQTFSTLIVINPIGQWLNRNTHGWWADGTLLLRLKYYPLPVLGAALVSASVFAVWQWRSLGNPEPIAFWVVFFAVIASVANGTLVPLLNMLGYRKLFVLLSNLSVGIGFLLAWLFSLESASAAMWLLGQSLGLILGAVLSWLFLLKQKTQQFNSGKVFLLDKATLIQFCMPLAASTAMMWALTAGWRFLAEYGWGLHVLGMVYVALALTLQIWSLAESLLMQILIPLFYRAIQGQNNTEMGQVFSSLFNAQLPVYLLLLGATVLSCQALLILFVATPYHQAGLIVVLGAFIEFFRVMSNVTGNAAQATFNTRSLIKPYSLAVVCLLVFFLTSASSQLPVEFAVISIGLAGAVLFFFMVRAMKLLLPWHIEWSHLRLPLAYLVVALLIVPFLPNLLGVHQALAWVALVGVLSTCLAGFVVSKNAGFKALFKVRLQGG